MNGDVMEQQLSDMDTSQLKDNCTNKLITVDDDYWVKLDSILDAKIKVIENKYDTAISIVDCKVTTLVCKCKQYEEDITNCDRLCLSSNEF